MYKPYKERACEQSVYWYNKAANLKTAYEILSMSMSMSSDAVHKMMKYARGFSIAAQVGDVSPMIGGLALELLFKACIVEHESRVPPTTHNLTDLANKAKIELNSDQKKALSAFTEFIFWAGKYPLPKKMDKFKSLFSAAWPTRQEPLFGRYSATVPDEGVRASIENFHAIWVKAHSFYFDLVQQNARNRE